MLVLTQKEGEVLQLGDDIRIYIKKVKGNMVRLCIDAPREVPILRVPSTPSRRPFQRPEGVEKGLGGAGGDGLRQPSDASASSEEGVPSGESMSPEAGAVSSED